VRSAAMVGATVSRKPGMGMASDTCLQTRSGNAYYYVALAMVCDAYVLNWYVAAWVPLSSWPSFGG
jgi:hypothetical protein